jgi:hypothetical protein
MKFQWKILELFAADTVLASVKYCLVADDDQNIVESEGNHTFNNGIVTKPLDQIVESDIVQWLEKDTIIDGVNPIKSNLEDQLMKLKLTDTLKVSKVDFPWLAGTFTI